MLVGQERNLPLSRNLHSSVLPEHRVMKPLPVIVIYAAIGVTTALTSDPDPTACTSRDRRWDQGPIARVSREDEVNMALSRGTEGSNCDPES